MPEFVVPSSRSVVVWGAFALAVCGWGGVAWSWLDHGAAAQETPGFYVALSVGVMGVLAFSMAFVMPDQARLYARGYEAGMRWAMACEACPMRDFVAAPVEPVRHLSPVR